MNVWGNDDNWDLGDLGAPSPSEHGSEKENAGEGDNENAMEMDKDDEDNVNRDNIREKSANKYDAVYIRLFEEHQPFIAYNEYVLLAVVEMLQTDGVTSAVFKHPDKGGHLALSCPSVQYLLCNHTHCVYVDEEEDEFRQVARSRLALVDARLEAEKNRNSRKRGEERWIYALDISRYVFFFTKYLSMAFIKCNI